MAGEWIKVRTNLWDDPRVSQLCDLTKSPEATIVGGLYWLWAAADEHTESGLMTGLSVSAIDRKTGIKGFGAALVTIGWIEDTPDGILIIRFGEHNGASAKARAQTAKRVSNHKGNAKVTQAALPEQHGSVSDALPREEKIREELTSTTSTADAVDVASVADAVSGPARNKPDCPHQDIIALYHEILPQCPQVRDWTPARATQLRARWNEDESRQSLGYWRRYFEYVRTCGFLVGQAQGNGRPFFADLEWLTKSGNFTKVREAKYES